MEEVCGRSVGYGKKATQPRPCGYDGDPVKECTCSSSMITRYCPALVSASLGEDSLTRNTLTGRPTLRSAVRALHAPRATARSFIPLDGTGLRGFACLTPPDRWRDLADGRKGPYNSITDFRHAPAALGRAAVQRTYTRVQYSPFAANQSTASADLFTQGASVSGEQESGYWASHQSNSA